LILAPPRLAIRLGGSRTPSARLAAFRQDVTAHAPRRDHASRCSLLDAYHRLMSREGGAGLQCVRRRAGSRPLQGAICAVLRMVTMPKVTNLSGPKPWRVKAGLASRQTSIGGGPSSPTADARSGWRRPIRAPRERGLFNAHAG
jgi:hypothetical protein